MRTSRATTAAREELFNDFHTKAQNLLDDLASLKALIAALTPLPTTQEEADKAIKKVSEGADRLPDDAEKAIQNRLDRLQKALAAITDQETSAYQQALRELLIDWAVRLAELCSGSVLYDYTGPFLGCALKIQPGTQDRLANDRVVASMGADRVYHAHLQTVPMGITRLYASPLLNLSLSPNNKIQNVQTGPRGADRISGVLRIALPTTYGARRIAPLVPAFLDRHPQLKIDLMMSDRYENLIAEGAELALRVGQQPDSSFVARKLESARRLLHVGGLRVGTENRLVA